MKSVLPFVLVLAPTTVLASGTMNLPVFENVPLGVPNYLPEYVHEYVAVNGVLRHDGPGSVYAFGFDLTPDIALDSPDGGWIARLGPRSIADLGGSSTQYNVVYELYYLMEVKPGQTFDADYMLFRQLPANKFVHWFAAWGDIDTGMGGVYEGTVRIVPEPASFAALGLLVVVVRRRRRKGSATGDRDIDRSARVADER